VIPYANLIHFRNTNSEKTMRKASEQAADIAQQVVVLLWAPANEQRLIILCKLSADEMSIGQMNVFEPLGQSALSQHLLSIAQDLEGLCACLHFNAIHIPLKTNINRAVVDLILRY